MFCRIIFYPPTSYRLTSCTRLPALPLSFLRDETLIKDSAMPDRYPTGKSLPRKQNKRTCGPPKKRPRYPVDGASEPSFLPAFALVQSRAKFAWRASNLATAGRSLMDARPGAPASLAQAARAASRAPLRRRRGLRLPPRRTDKKVGQGRGSSSCRALRRGGTPPPGRRPVTNARSPIARCIAGFAHGRRHREQAQIGGESGRGEDRALRSEKTRSFLEDAAR